jgi:hypothetical protein
MLCRDMSITVFKAAVPLPGLLADKHGPQAVIPARKPKYSSDKATIAHIAA